MPGGGFDSHPIHVCLVGTHSAAGGYEITDWYQSEPTTRVATQGGDAAELITRCSQVRLLGDSRGLHES